MNSCSVGSSSAAAISSAWSRRSGSSVRRVVAMGEAAGQSGGVTDGMLDPGGVLEGRELAVEVGEQALQVRQRAPAAREPERHLVGIAVAGDVQRHPVD